MNIAVVGSGYVGLVSGTCYAESGNEVVCVDIDEKRIAQLCEGKIPIYEPGLEELVRRNLKEGRLRFTTDIADAIKQSMVSYIAVGTPMSASGAADLSAFFKAAEDIANAITGYHIVAVKSTVPVGTNDRVREIVGRIAKHRADVCSVPEFLKEGSAIEDFMRPDRVVIGSLSEQATAILKEIHNPFVRTDNPILVMDPRSAELTKYASNAMLAMRISFINEMATLCDAVGADINAVRRGLGTDKRIGPSFLFPGVGYGGSCFPKDVQAMIHTASEHNLDFALLRAAEAVNARQKRLIPARVKQHFGQNLSGRTFAIWGLAFKPRTDDMREAPALVVVEELLQAGAKCRVHDPEALENARKFFGDRVTYHKTNYEALKDADALLILTEWNEFRHPNFQRIKAELKEPVIFDGRNLYDPDLMKALELRYYSIGRHPVQDKGQSYENSGDRRRRLYRLAHRGCADRIGRDRGFSDRQLFHRQAASGEPESDRVSDRSARCGRSHVGCRKSAARNYFPSGCADGCAAFGRRSCVRRAGERGGISQPDRIGAQTWPQARRVFFDWRRDLRRTGRVSVHRGSSETPGESVRCREAGDRGLSLLLQGRVRDRLPRAEIRQRVRPAPGSARRSRRHLDLLRENSRWPAGDDLRRRLTDARLCIRRRRGSGCGGSVEVQRVGICDQHRYRPETKVNDLYATLAGIADFPTKAEHAAARGGEQKRSVISPARAEKELGWRPEKKLAEGLEETFKYFKQQRDRPN